MDILQWFLSFVRMTLSGMARLWYTDLVAIRNPQSATRNVKRTTHA